MIVNLLFLGFFFSICSLSQCVFAAGVNSSYEALYKHLFKTSFVKKLQPYNSNLVLNGKFLGAVSLLASATGPIDKVEASSFLAMIRSSLKDIAYSELLTMVDTEGFISERDLSLVGYALSFSRSHNYLVVTIPRDKRTDAVFLDLQSGSWEAKKVTGVVSQQFSGYVNFRGALNRLETDVSTVESPLSIETESVVNMDGLTFRQLGHFESENSSPYAVRDIQVVKDDSSEWTRYILGDINFPARGFQGTPRIFGIGMGKLYYLNPQLLDSGNQSTSVKVLSNGVMTLFLNGTELRQFNVEKGTYTLENIPIRIGLNRLVVMLSYADGSREELEKTFVRDLALIGVGSHEFYYGAGVYSANSNRRYVVNTEKPVVSGYHMYRPDAFWIQGAYFQADNEQHLLGLDTYFPTTFGVFRLDTAYFGSVNSDFGSSLEYTTYYDPGGLVGSQRVTLSSFGSGFRRFGALVSGFRRFGALVESKVAQSLRADTSLNLTKDSALSLHVFAKSVYSEAGFFYGGGGNFVQQWESVRAVLGGSYSENTSGLSLYNFTADFHAKFTKEWQTVLRFSWKNPVEIGDFTLSYSLTWAPGEHTITAGTQDADQTQRLGYSYNGASGFFATGEGLFSSDRLGHTRSNFSNIQTIYLGQRDPYSDLQLNSRFANSRQTKEATHALRYWNTRGLFDVRYLQSKALNTDHFTRSISYRFETALVFADWQMGFSRPIRSNFVLVYPEEGLVGKSFVVGNQGLVDMFGPAVITDLPPWSETLMSIGEIQDVPEGYDMGALRQRIGVGYYSGQAIRVGNRFRTRVFGVAKTAAGPLAYVACEVFNDDTLKTVVTQVLTGADGRFLIQGLRPGSYGIRFKAFTDDVLYFDLEDGDSVRSYDIGEVVLSQKEVAPTQEE